MYGYTMEEAQAITRHDSGRALLCREGDPDRAALLELRVLYEKGTDPLLLISSAFALGHAIGVREERDRLHGRPARVEDTEATARAHQALQNLREELQIRHLFGQLSTEDKDAMLQFMRDMIADREGATA